jgi:UDPglucose--hexose-1-phosphate uridylyltransferase
MNIAARQAAQKVEELIAYANENLYLKNEDNVYIRNLLLHALNLKEPSAESCGDADFFAFSSDSRGENKNSYGGKYTQCENKNSYGESGESKQDKNQNAYGGKYTQCENKNSYGESSYFQEEILNPLLDYAAENGLCGNTATEKILYETRLLGIVSPLPSFITEKFEQTALKYGVSKATDFLNDFSIKSNYIRTADINKNIQWETSGEFGKIIISINRSKPEKGPKEIEAAKNTPKGAYPKCPLCKDNVGFFGGLNQSARQTLRTIPILLNNESWQFQFSPYVYFNKHCIALSDEHRPMKVDKSAFVRMFDFTDLFRHFFIGSNAALPIVGGSILAHDHFQGGDKVLPMFSASDRRTFQSKKYKNVSISIVDWYNSVVRLRCKNRAELTECAAFILEKWQEYRDESVDIIPFTISEDDADGLDKTANSATPKDADGSDKTVNSAMPKDADGSENTANSATPKDADDKKRIPHNAVTAIARLEDDGTYILDMILRNNRTNEEFPFGIFHPPVEFHNVKKEGIGIIEVMGLFILPGRLYEECREIAAYLCGEKPLVVEELFRESNMLYKHAHAVLQLANDNGLEMKREDAERTVTDYINSTCENILNCTAVFKNTDKGQKAFGKFVDTII